MAQGRLFDAMAQTLTRSLAVSAGAGSGPAGVSGGMFGLGTSGSQGSRMRARLATVLPSPSDTSITEPSGNGYTPITNYINTTTAATVSNTNAWTAGGMTGGSGDPWTVTNDGGGIRWPEATGSWGTIYAVVFTDQAGTGESNLVCYFELDTPVTIDATDIFQIDEGELSFSFGDFVTY